MQKAFAAAVHVTVKSQMWTPPHVETRRDVCSCAEVGRLGRSSSAAGMRHVGTDVQRQSSLPAREALNQVNILYMY